MAGKACEGGVWTWVRLDADSRMLISNLMGDRSAGCAFEFIGDLTERIDKRVRLTSNGYFAYPSAVLGAFGVEADFAMFTGTFTPDVAGNTQERRYRCTKCNCACKVEQLGLPAGHHLSTNYVERQNASLRLFNERFGRLTLALSDRLINHEHAIALHHFAHDLMRKLGLSTRHRQLRQASPTTSGRLTTW
ncbi:MAG TPA: hypothetical protein P5572_03310 [Phycisphaerae bacterium]|nr:hypothetical protein [Phycisphaerales bacterium]HRX84028.1 hypothetical protein [Phycisphaerae bacterium]